MGVADWHGRGSKMRLGETKIQKFGEMADFFVIFTRLVPPPASPCTRALITGDRLMFSNFKQHVQRKNGLHFDPA